VVVNDGSTDSTKDYLKWLDAQDKKNVVIVDNKGPNGRSIARNVGNSVAKGDVICVLDADDLSYPKRAEITLKKFNEGAEFLYGSAILIDSVGQKMGQELADVFNKEEALKNFQNRIVHSTVAYRKELARDFPYILGVVSDMGIDDWAQQVQMAMSGVKMTSVPNVLSAYRLLQTAISKTRDEKKVLEFKKEFMKQFKVTA
jgi:glycosyltransferase involved in cell wall biosynthesis